MNQQELDSYILHHPGLHENPSAKKYANAFMHYALDNPEMPSSVKAMESWFAFAIMSGFDSGKAQERLHAQDILSVK